MVEVRGKNNPQNEVEGGELKVIFEITVAATFLVGGGYDGGQERGPNESATGASQPGKLYAQANQF
jgi:hypothetical protein